jgi:cell wall-associated NlpC family hydrolase
MRKLLNKICLGIIVFAFITGCAPSSSAQRYGGKKTKTEQTKNSSRYKKPVVKEKPVIESRNVETIPDSSDEEFDDAPPSESTMDKKQFLANYKNYINPDVPLGLREQILLEVIKFLNTPYKYGGNSENGIDCSGFTKQIYSNAMKIDLPRSAKEQYDVGEQVDGDLDFGDLVFFNTRRRSNPGHVGLYIGDNQFIHASRKLGVTISSLEETYYKKRYVGARRIDDEMPK